jgi:DNA ligase-1
VRKFARLYTTVDETMRTTEKVDAMASYFRSADAADAAWAVYFLSGGR